MEASDLGQRKTAVVFDLWGTLVPFPRSGWDAALARMAAALGADLDQFLPAWHADYAERAVGDVEAARAAAEAVANQADTH